jgi:hypothetical protein
MSDETRLVHQSSPFPTPLRVIVDELSYKPGWRFALDENFNRGQDCVGLTLSIYINPPDAYRPDERRPVRHIIPVPPAAFDYQSWRRWMLEQILLVERHEACEFFAIGDEHPFAPNHGEGRDPYVVFDYATDEQRRTSFRNEIKPAD